MKDAAIAPPGVMPSQQPMKEERNSVTQYFGKSFQTDSTTRREMPAAWPRSARRSSMVRRISLMRNWPDTVSMPMPASNRPSDIEITVLCLASRPSPTKEQKVSRYTEKNSGGPNFSANDEIIGARNVIRSTATSEPMKDEVNAAVSASAALPCCAIG